MLPGVTPLEGDTTSQLEPQEEVVPAAEKLTAEPVLVIDTVCAAGAAVPISQAKLIWLTLA